MRRSLWQRLDALARHLTPFGLTVVLVLLGQVPFHLPGFAQVAPMLPLIAIYHWTVYRPELMPAVAVFLVGLLQDALSGLPFGVNTLVYLIAYGVVLTQRSFLVGKSFPIVWFGFALVGAAATLVAWGLVSAISATVVEGRAGFFQYLVTLGGFPLVSWLFARWQHSILKAE